MSAIAPSALAQSTLTESATPLVGVEDVHAYYGKSHILHGVSLNVAPGEVVGLLGRNGVGKSTTLKTIMGLVRPSRGAVRLNGVRITGLPPHKVARLGIGYVPEDRRIFRLLARGPRIESYLGQLRKSEKLDFASWGGYAQNYALRRISFDDPASAEVYARAVADEVEPDDPFMQQSESIERDMLCVLYRFARRVRARLAQEPRAHAPTTRGETDSDPRRRGRG